MDIKLRFASDFNVLTLFDKEVFVSDGTFVHSDGSKKESICNGLIVVRAKSPIMLNCIEQIVQNVANKFYGTNPWIVTGPQLLGLSAEPFNIKTSFQHAAILKGVSKILQNGTTIASTIDKYRDSQNEPYFVDLWNEKAIYM